MDEIKANEYRQQLAGIEELLRENPDNEELQNLKKELEEIISLAEEIKQLKEPKRDIFAHESSSEDELAYENSTINSDNKNPIRSTAINNFIRFQKTEELIFDQENNAMKVIHTSNSELFDTHSSNQPNNQSQESKFFTLHQTDENDTKANNSSESDSESDFTSSSDSKSEYTTDSECELKEINQNNNNTQQSSIQSENNNNNNKKYDMFVDAKFKHIAEWEKYEKGIGSKILAKYGYVKGMGLGKFQKGIVEPLTILEQSGNIKAGLGHEKRRRKKREISSNTNENEENGKEKKRKIEQNGNKTRRRKRQKQDNTQMTEESTTTIFDFLNQQLATEPTHKEKQPLDKFKGLSYEELKKQHIQYKLQIEEYRIEKEKLEKIYQLNKTKDPDTALRVKKRIQHLVTKMKLLSEDEMILSSKVIFTEGRKKMEKF